MSRLLSVGCLLTCFALFSACARATAPSEPEMNAAADVAAVDTLRENIEKAYNAGDAAAFGELYAEDVVSEPNDAPTVSDRDAVVASQKALFEQSTVKISLTSDEVRTVGATGFSRGHYSVEVTPKAGGLTRAYEGRYLALLVKDADGTWRVSRDMDNVAAPTAPAPDSPQPQ